ncbi:MAG: hypothetical protein RR022_08060, partial [Angelakisella sp.]
EQVSNESLSYDKRQSCRELQAERLAEWEVAKVAIQYITGKAYAFTRTDEYYGIVNEADDTSWLYQSMR